MRPLRAFAASLLRAAAIALPLTLASTPTVAWAECPAFGPHHISVRLDNPGGPLTDYFALLRMSTAGLIGAGLMRPDAQDLRVADITCNPLSFWVESGVNTTATRIWVEVSAVPAGVSQIELYFGNLGFTRVNQASDVFGPGVASLYTFTEGSGTTVTDWVGGHDLTVSAGLTWGIGPRAGVSAISGFAADRLLAADNGSLLGNSSFTVLAAINPAVADGTTAGIIGAYDNDSVNGWLLKLQGGDAGQFMLLTNQGGDWCQAPGGSVAIGQWSFVGGRRQAGVVSSLLQNGAVAGDICAGDARTVDNPTTLFELGRGYTGNYPFPGSLSLSMLYTSALSDQDVAALHASLFPSVQPTVSVDAVAVTSPNTTTFTVTAPGTFTFTASGIRPDIDLSGALPAGVVYNDTTETISGTPAVGTVGVYPLTVTATSALGVQVTQNFTLTVVKAPQTIAFANPGPQVTGGPPLTLSANATSGLPVVFTSSTPGICTVSGNSATMIAVGTCTIGANQPGDANYLAAPGVSQSFAAGVGLPHRPIAVTATVRGNVAMVSWTPAATGPVPDAFLVDIGDGPGRTTLTSLLTNQLAETGLLPQGEYYFRVRAQNAVGLSEPSDDVWVNLTASSPVAAPPIALSGFVAGTTVSLAWSSAALGARPESFLLQVGTDPFSANLGQVILPAGTNFVSATNVPQGTYVVRVRAITSTGPSSASPALWLRVGPPAPCSAAASSPMMLTPVISDHFVRLSWLPPADASAKSFVVQAGTGPGLADIAVVDVGAVAGLGAVAGDGRYMVRALSTSDCGASAASVEQTLTLGGPKPAAPTGLSAASGPGGLTFTWTPAASGAAATHFVLEAGLAPGTTLLKIPTGATPSLTIPGVPSGITFVARVRGANVSGIGAASTEIVVTVP